MVLITLSGWVNGAFVYVHMAAATEASIDEIKMAVQRTTGVHRGTYWVSALTPNGGRVRVDNGAAIASLPLNGGEVTLEPTWNGRER
jgi:hypothetical protein